MTNMQNVEDTSPYDILSNGIKKWVNKSQDIVSDIYKEVTKGIPILTKHQSSKNYKYVVDIPKDTLKLIEKGEVKLNQENGKLLAQLRNKDGKYGDKLSITKENFCQDVSPIQLTNALQLQALQKQLENMENQLNMISASVKEVLQGQQNDRIALYHSGLSLFLESRNVSNESLKNELISQALRALSESTYKLKLTMKDSITYLVEKQFKIGKGNVSKLIKERMDTINQCFGYIHQSIMLRAGIYCDIGELSTMSRVLNEYSYFIENDVTQNAELLTQYDVNDDGTQNGLWASRTKLQLDTNLIYNTLNNPNKTLYLSIEKENE